MGDIKYSALLEELIESAKKIGNIPNPPLTAERFVVAIINKIYFEDEELSDELEAVRGVFEQSVKDVAEAKVAMLEYIYGDNTRPFLDELYMVKKLEEAAQLAVDVNESEISALNLLMHVLNDPSDTLDSVMVVETDDAPSASRYWKDFSGASEDDDGGIDVQDFLDGTNDILSGKDIMSNLVSDVKRIRTQLGESIFGQDNAINVFAKGYFQASMLSMIDRSRRRPRATFLFAGPPGVGKTYLAEKAAEALDLPFMRFDMSEYADKEANLEFCGSDKVYKNGKKGNVTGFVEGNPHCVLLFDEIEKAHISVIHLFLQMLDAGRLRDNFTDEEVSFSDAIIILTTNAGKQLYENSENSDLSCVSRKVIINALQKDVNPETGVPYFPGAICSRFASGNVIMFNHIGAHNLYEIAKKEIERHAKNLEIETGLELKIDERVYTALIFAEGSSADARTIRGRAETFFNDELYELLRLISSDKVETGIKTLKSINIGVDLENVKQEIFDLFEPSSKTKILVFAGTQTVEFCQKQAPCIDFIAAQDIQTALELLKKHDIDLVLLEMNCGTQSHHLKSLNIEDVESPSRDFFKFLKEHNNNIPIYLIDDARNAMSDEETVSFIRQGVRGILSVSGSEVSFLERITTLTQSLHQQSSMNSLARQNKFVAFETAQSISNDGHSAEIKLFDFKTSVAVDAEDARNILNSVSKPNVRFDDVIGADGAKEELKYFVEYLKNPKKYMGTGVKSPRGVILYGPPGTGKTMLAKAMACESGVTFIAAEGNQFLKKLVGEGSEKVHELFSTARKYAPSILFIDEIDAIAKERSGATGSNAGTEETLTAFLTEMDGFASDPTKPVFVLAATNFDVEPGKAKSLDPALMRRFDRRVYIELPNKQDRIRFLNMKIAKNHALDISKEQIDNIAIRATGMSLAELDSVVELALRSAIRENSTVVNDAILEEAFETFNGGEVKKWDISQLERVARHEAGHALLCWLGGETPSYLTIVARGDHGGYMQHAEHESRAIYTKGELLAKIRTALGGRAAEIVCYGERDGISTGASGDLASATDIARKIVCSFGMDDDFGLAITVDDNSAEVRASLNRILKEQMQEALKLVLANRDKLDSLVEELMSKNHLNEAQIHKILSGERN